MKPCTACGRQLDDSVEMCTCGQWLRVERTLPPEVVGAPRKPYVEGVGDRWLNMWGGACGFLSGAALPEKSAVISVALFGTGYLVSMGILALSRRFSVQLSSLLKFVLAGAYFVGAFMLIVISDLIVNP